MIRIPAVFNFQRHINVVDRQNEAEKEQSLSLTEGDKIISLEELSFHDHAKDCWIVIKDKVYNVTDFLNEHPAGSDILLEYAGRDGTIAFRASGHSSLALGALDTFLIGQLPVNQRLYGKTN
ncbi:hypothetical protein JTB14_010073 [Gonioctena quinquepunctata]|nr:hypothetical protein JTB14_010073 [Gonioctena quinquepunctata]